MGWIGLRTLSFLMVQKEQYWDGLSPEEIWIPRDQWLPFDPFLLAEGYTELLSKRSLLA
jgi:hypothetical protein